MIICTLSILCVATTKAIVPHYLQKAANSVEPHCPPLTSIGETLSLRFVGLDVETLPDEGSSVFGATVGALGASVKDEEKRTRQLTLEKEKEQVRLNVPLIVCPASAMAGPDVSALRTNNPRSMLLTMIVPEEKKG